MFTKNKCEDRDEKNNLKLTVIVPTYNVEDYISRCLDSLLNQDDIEIEIIVVNDGSTDNTHKIINEYQKKYDNIKIINENNQGLYKAKTNGIGFATYDFITFCDPDDYIDANFYAPILNRMIENEADIIQFGYRRIKDEKTIWSYIPKEEVMDGKEATRRMLETTNFAHSNWCKIYHKKVLENVAFDEDIRCDDEDVLIHVKVLPHVTKVCSVSDVGYNYVIRRGSIVDTGTGIRGINILRTDQIIYNYAKANLSKELVKSVAYDYCAKLAYWYNKCYLLNERKQGDKVLSDFYKVLKNNHLFLYFPKGCSIKRVSMISLLALNPTVCRQLFSKIV